MANVLGDEKKHQVLALGRLGWSLRRIEKRDWCPSRNGERVSARGRDRGAARGRATR